jgi:hypothetical protein
MAKARNGIAGHTVAKSVANEPSIRARPALAGATGLKGAAAMTTSTMPGFTAETSLLLQTATRSSSSTVTPDAGLIQPARFICGGGLCGCQGDEDCNNMFTYACGGGYAQCWSRSNDSNVFCLCS